MAISERGRLAGFKVGTVGPVLVGVFHGAATLPALKLLEQVEDRFVKEHRTIFSVTVVVGDKLVAPDREVREYSALLLKRFDPLIAGAAVVLDVKGVAAVVGRTFMAALSLLQGNQKPNKTFKSVHDAVVWMRGLPNQAPAVLAIGDLEQQLEEFVRELRPAPR